MRLLLLTAHTLTYILLHEFTCHILRVGMPEQAENRIAQTCESLNIGGKK